ncbi:MAG: hypothetical protein MJ130_06060 [Lachnospiraceae bacterium]|nr:hypothetical protein [Lachnospiraceae bacterium]
MLALLIVLSMTVRAAEMSVDFTAKKYDKTSGNEFSVGTKLNSDIAISSYTIVIEYDKSRLEVIDGGQSVDRANGTVTCTGSGSHLTNIKFWIDFRAISGGDAYITVVSANAVGTDGTEYSIADLGTVPVTLRGDDVSEQNLIELETADDGVGALENGSDTEGSADIDGASNDGTDKDENSTSNINSGENAEEVLEGSSANDPIADGAGAGSENNGRRKLIYWLVVALIIAVLVLIVALSTFGGKKAKHTSEDYSDDEYADGGYAEDEAGLIFEGEEETAESDEAPLESDETPSETVYRDYEPLVGNDPFEDMPVEEEDGVDEEEPEPAMEEAEASEEEPETAEEEVETSEEIEPAEKAEPVAKVNSEAIFAANDVTVRCKVRSKNPARTDFDVINVLDRISLKLYRGELVEITGTSNRELEAFIYLLTGKCKIRSGNVEASLKRCRTVTAKSCFDPRLTVRANIYRSGALMGHPKTTLDKCFSRVIKFAGAEDAVDKPAGSVSMTTIHKLEVALALLDDRVDVLILGNVLDKCDENFVRKCNVILGKMLAKDITVLLFGIIPETIAANCSRTIRIINGHISER